MSSRAVLVAGALLLAGLPAASICQESGNGGSAARTTQLHAKPGDQVAVVIPLEPELTDTVLVNERGEAAFAKLGVLLVSQFTIAELKDTIRARYARVLRSPAIEVSVLRRVAVSGEVRCPNIYLVDVTTTLRELIARSCGLTDAGSPKRVSIVRDGRRVAAAGWQQGTIDGVDLHSGDQILVGRKNWLVLNALPAISTAVLVTSLLISLKL